MRLPPELLAYIFALLASIDPPELYTLPMNGSPGWLAATHVCQRWRRVALEDPTLWAANISVPFPLGPRWADRFLSRAQDAPLTI
ncbi:hypothetical protein FA95DRAFT_1500023, partial [Auriscalpium vulgare]